MIFSRRRTYERQRILHLEQQIALGRLHQELNEKRLAKIFEAVLDLRTTMEAEIGQLRSQLNRLLAERSAIRGVRPLSSAMPANAVNNTTDRHHHRRVYLSSK